ncbi:MAG: aminoglycoside phosphotransferase family protein [Actinomycetota bacterium]|nr:aminoglycoside phosphotransferase family protein [Actinomycetota bacterium]
MHRTFLATYRRDGGAVARYVHQRLNTSVFADVETLMANFVRVTTHLAVRTGDRRRAVRLCPAADGRPFARDAAGAPWRTLEFIDGARTYARFEGPAHAAEGAALAASLVADLTDLTPPLPEVIPGFHDVVRRLDALAHARAADDAGRAHTCGELVDAVLAHRGLASEVAEARADGRLPERTVHNDTKTENLLFDETTGGGLCLVDLDTVGPGTVLFDVGDLVRSGATALPEDGDPYAVSVDNDLVAAVLDGYARAGAGFLTPAEVDLLPAAGPLMALESAARFLTDYLRGDVYFPVEGPHHNLRRARNQLRLLELLATR